MKIYAAIGTKGLEDIILGMFRSESDAEDFANDFDKTHCDVSEDDLFYSDEDFDAAIDWCQEAKHPERWDYENDLPLMVPEDYDIQKLISDIKINDILYECWDTSRVIPINVIDAYEGPHTVEEIYKKNKIKLDDYL